MNPFSNTRKPGPLKQPVVIIAVDQADANAYAERHGETRHIAVTPRSLIAARGRVAPVYATRKARLHARYADMLAESKTCGATLPRKARDRRVA